MHHLEYRNLLQIKGNFKEVKGFLQGLVTNDVEKLEKNVPLYTLMLTPQGKIISDIFIYCLEQEDSKSLAVNKEENGAIYLDVSKVSREIIFRKLSMYKIGRNIEVINCPKKYIHIKKKNCAHTDPRIKGFGRVISDKQEQEQNLYDEYREILMQECIPEFDSGVRSEKFYPIDFDMDKIAGSVNYKKGCYVGQEVTARARYRGVKRKFLKIREEDDMQNEKDVVINRHKRRALALVREKA